MANAPCIVSVERLESEDGLVGKTFTGLLGSIDHPADGSGTACKGSIAILHAMSLLHYRMLPQVRQQCVNFPCFPVSEAESLHYI